MAKFSIEIEGTNEIVKVKTISGSICILGKDGNVDFVVGTYDKEGSSYVVKVSCGKYLMPLEETVATVAAAADACLQVFYAQQALLTFASLATRIYPAIAEQADLQNEANEVADAFAELDLVPENACEDIALEALQAGAAFDNSAPLPSFSKQYDLSGDIDEINEVIDSIAVEQADDLTAIDDEITRLKARLLSLGSTRQDIIEEYVYWHCKAQERLNELEYDEAYDDNEAQADLRQSIWLATGQDIM